MDKLQMTVTLSADSAPELLAYLRQYSGARERAFMLKLLAQRGLQVVLSAGPDALLRPLVASTAMTAATEKTPEQFEQPAPTAPRPATSDSPPSSSRAHQPLNAALHAPSARHDATANSSMTEQTQSTGAEASGSLAGLDIGALNDAMARFD